MENYTIFYEGIPIEYHLQRKNIKYINLRVNKYEQVVVSAPLQVPLCDIHAFVQEKAAWIIAHLAEMEKIKQSQPSPLLYDGKTLYYLGEPYTLQLCQGLPHITITKNKIRIQCYTQDQQKLRAMYLQWLKVRAKHTFSTLLDELLPLPEPYIVPYPTIQIRNMKSIWGSCSVSDAKIRLNLQLIKADTLCIQQVILHELIHFLHPNHSKVFYDVLHHIMPDWQIHKKRLETAYRDGI